MFPCSTTLQSFLTKLRSRELFVDLMNHVLTGTPADNTIPSHGPVICWLPRNIRKKWF